VPVPAGGAIIGKGGAVVKQLNDETGGRTSVSPLDAVSQVTSERIVSISGNLGAIEAVFHRLVILSYRDPEQWVWTNRSSRYTYDRAPSRGMALAAATGGYGVPSMMPPMYGGMPAPGGPSMMPGGPGSYAPPASSGRSHGGAGAPVSASAYGRPSYAPPAPAPPPSYGLPAPSYYGAPFAPGTCCPQSAASCPLALSQVMRVIHVLCFAAGAGS
jgi:hypothetical protein